MRISDGMRFRFAQSQLTNLTARQAEAAQRTITGRRVNAPSDDPVAAAEITKAEGRLTRIQSYRESISLARSDAAIAEGALSEAQGLLVRARELAVQGANGTLNAQDREHIAGLTGALREQLVSIANTRGSRGYLFAGSQTDSAAFAADGSYQGDAYEHQLEVAPGVTTTVNVSGERAFSAAGGIDVFQVLADLTTALENDDAGAIAATLDQLDVASRQVVGSQAGAGLLMNRLDSSEASLEQSELSLRIRKGELGEIDAFQAITELTALNSTLEQAIAVTRLTLNQQTSRF